MNRIFIYIASLALLSAFWACGSNSDSGVDALTDAEDRFEAGYTSDAVGLADHIVADSALFNSLNARQLCRLSILFVRTAENPEDGANMASAAKCLRRAGQLEPDTVASFMRNLPFEEMTQMAALYRVGTYLDVPRDSLVSTEETPIEQVPETKASPQPQKKKKRR